MTDQQTPAAGWYPISDSQVRYWDGTAWTDAVQERHDIADHHEPKASGAFRGMMTTAADRLVSKETELPAGTIWSAVGKPLKGYGAGRYRMDDRYLYFEKGTLRTDSQQVLLSDVVDVDVAQSMAQKARSVFNISVHIERPGGRETVVMADIPDGRAAQRIINESAHNARLELQRTRNTMRYESAGVAPQAPTPAAAPPVTAAAPQPPAGDDLMAKLTKLAEMKSAGLLTDEEFAAAKARLLG